MTCLEILTVKTNQVLNTYKNQLPKYPVEPPFGTDDLDGFLAA